jgi:flagellar biosynthesis protein FlhF
MKAKTYTAKSIQRALDQIKHDVGPDALILSTQEITTRRALGLIRRHKWVVTAAVNDAPAPQKVSETPMTSILRMTPPRVESPVPRTPAKPDTSTPPASKPNEAATPAVVSRLQVSDSRLEELLGEVSGLKSTLHWITKSIPASSRSTSGVFKELVEQGFDPEVTEQIIAAAERHGSSDSDIRSRVRAALEEMLIVEPPAEFVGRTRTVSIFIGPTGAGKTTAIGKIAGQAKAKFAKKVAMISVDPFESKGHDQIARFGDLLGIPAYSCGDAVTLNKLLAMLDEDLILIDTPGTSLNDSTRINFIKSILATANARVHIVVSASTRPGEIARTVKRFATVRAKRVLVTKTDETECKTTFVGSVLNLETPVSFITNGQGVPEDLCTPTAGELANQVMPLETVEVAKAALC